MAVVIALFATTASGLAPTMAQAVPFHRFLYESKGYETGEPPIKHTFSEPCGVVVDSHGDVYVAQGPEIDVFGPAGNYITRIVDGHNPCGLAIDSTGQLYVTELWERLPRLKEAN
jgi:sugar lactone lactonase YvrE